MPSVNGKRIYDATSKGDGLRVLVVIALVWAGLLLGVSFLATPVKFMAPSLTLPVALDVGRHTFAVFNWVEIVAGGGLLAGAFLSRTRSAVVLALSAAVLVAVQSLWLLPVLDSRVAMILQGQMPPASSLHTVYILVDVAKLLALLTAALLGLRRV